MKVLIACEFSGVVREAFNAHHGVHAVSCDILPAEDGRDDVHRQGDVRRILHEGWDMMIAFPPCTYLCNSGVRWLNPKGTINGARFGHMIIAVEFFNELLEADIPKIAVENPIQHCYARERIRKYRSNHSAVAVWTR